MFLKASSLKVSKTLTTKTIEKGKNRGKNKGICLFFWILIIEKVAVIYALQEQGPSEILNCDSTHISHS